jgi:cyclophilin family peptidyl-prolyl cis-trans isomerase/FKBP-type peptidyl-prolyl cis-trans isomerase
MKTRLPILIFLLLNILFVSCQDKHTDLEDGLFAEFKTTHGTMVTELYYEKTPITVANFVALAEGNHPEVQEVFKGKPYYNGIIFHRVMDKFMIQGGDPEATGKGGPGYQFFDEITNLKHDKPGVLSMANGGVATNGSQFFITEAPAPWLDGLHTVFGQLVKGIEIQDSISNVKTGPGTRPITDVVINELNIIRKGEAAQLFDAPKTWGKKNEIEKESRLKEEIKMKGEIRKLDSLAKIDLIKLDEYNKKSIKQKSGVKIYVIKQGKGIKPKDGNVVKLYADGYLTNGLLFWSNNKKINERHGIYDVDKEARGFYDPISMELSPNMQLIPGFKEAIYTMNVGDIIYCYIPYNLAYGDESKGLIKPNSDLSFIIQMVTAEN